jgi:Right handed beta helix region/Periplasmic copper-binding protein (NosD)
MFNPFSKRMFFMKLSLCCSLFFSLSLLCVTSVYADSHISRTHKESRVITQKDLPFVIDRSGEYSLCTDLTYCGAGSAITIIANNVKLNLNFSLTLTNPGATGVFVNGASEVVIKNDHIVNTSSDLLTGNGIFVLNGTHITIDNIYTLQNGNGLLVQNSRDVQVVHSRFENALVAGAQVAGSTNVDFTNSVFDNNGIGLFFAASAGSNQDCSVSKCKFPSSQSQCLFGQQIAGMNIDNCLFSNAFLTPGPDAQNVVQFGDEGALFNNLIIRNSTFVNTTSSNKGVEGLALFNGSGFIVDNCIFNVDNTCQDCSSDLSGVHLGDGSGVLVASNGVIRNCVSQGPCVDGYYPDVGVNGIVIENCLAVGCQKVGILGNGICSSAFINNVTMNNNVGIALDPASFNNLVQSNKTFNNSSAFSVGACPHPCIEPGAGIFDEGVEINNNQIYYNTAFQNDVNYAGNAANAVILAPGDPAKGGENIGGPLEETPAGSCLFTTVACATCDSTTK